MTHTRPIGLFIFLLALVGAAGCRGPLRNSQDLRGAELPQAIPRPDFHLTDTDGKPFVFARRTRGTLTLLAFGYTHCPDVCPVQMANIAAAMARLTAEQRARIRVVFVTTDPPRDSAARLRAWLDSFNRTFIGLRGTEAEIEAAERSVGVALAVKESSTASDSGYTVGHAAQVYAFTADDSAHRAYPFGTLQQDWAHDLPELLRGAH